MKTIKLFVLALLYISLLGIIGCESDKKRDVDEARLNAIKPPAQMPKMPEPSGGLVLSIESSAVTADEIINPVRPNLEELAAKLDYGPFMTNAKPFLASVLVQKVADIKLYIKAKAALPENVDEAVIDKIVEEEVQKFIARCGGDYSRVEQVLKKMGTSWQDFYQQQRRAILVQAFVSDEIKDDRPVTYSELVEYYNKIKDQYYEQKGQLVFRVIDIEPEKLYEPNDPNANLDQKAQKLAAELSERIRKGEDFNELAKKYSHDYMAQNGGLWKPVVSGSLAQPYDKIEKAVQDMNSGQVSEPIITRDHIFIVKLENKIAPASKPFEKVQNEVEARMLFERRKKTVDDMMDKIISQVDLSYADKFIEYCMEKAYTDWQAKRITQ